MLDTGEEKFKGRLINTLNPKWKKNGASVLLIAVLLIGILGTLAGCTIVNAGPSATEKSASSPRQGNALNEAVKSVFLKENQGHYLSGECIGEGHIILGHDEKSDITTVYALTMYGEYGFEDGNFVKVSGSGTIPVVFTFTNSKDGLVCTKIAYPEDGEGYAESIKNLFPLTYRNRALSPSDSDRQDLTSQERAYAASYLKKIGRDAVIGDYGDFKHTLLTDVGVSVEVSNMTCGKLYANYPMWIGNHEALENGTRYVYEMSYNQEAREIDFKKYEYNTKKIIEFIRLDSITGLQVN